jgi:hypothetical protein
MKEILAALILRKLLGKERTEKLNILAQKYVVLVASVIFGLIATLSTIAFGFGINISVAGFNLPSWFILIIVIISAFLSYELWEVHK